MKKILLLLFIVQAFHCQAQYYKQTVTFPPKASLKEKVDMASRVVPSGDQSAWQQLELTAFLHFGMNTFTNQEWGNGKEDPALFNPSELNTDQWVKAIKDAGFKLAILTAKHHDGFCLWQTQTTTHSVASSLWKNGKGDVMAEFVQSCKKYGIKVGVYLSPWDMNAASYGDSPNYNLFYMAQLTELLSRYGQIDEVWLDGACGEGPNGKKQVYDFPAYYELIRRLQPHAVIAISGIDVRWVGNERGYGRETEWSATALNYDTYPDKKALNDKIGINAMSKDLGSRKLLKKASSVQWWPSEVDVSIRPGWFYHASEDTLVKPVAQLVDIYKHSVGMNSSLLLNIPPDRRGLIHENDVKTLKNFGDYIQKSLADNKLSNGKQYWETKPKTSQEYAVNAGETINTIILQEDISKGQRVESFTIDVWLNNGWKEIAQGTTIGYKRLLSFPDLKTAKIRVNIKEARNTVNILQVGAYEFEEVK